MSIKAHAVHGMGFGRTRSRRGHPVVPEKTRPFVFVLQNVVVHVDLMLAIRDRQTSATLRPDRSLQPLIASQHVRCLLLGKPDVVARSIIGEPPEQVKVICVHRQREQFDLALEQSADHRRPGKMGLMVSEEDR